ncbi:hypothetical protein [Haloferax sp. Atlit-4N]|uniref:hypothetical protein n=1 Tax=Haloferax sp. Atlit-4N TaxID=2077206 RepID=UPI0011C052F6|nr:hypothetical protein [Haloferax sp. Atlit-4N]
MTVSNYSGIDLELSLKSNVSANPSKNNTPISGISEVFETYAERADRIQQERCSDVPRDVIGPTEKTDEGFHPVNVWDEVPYVEDNYFDRRKKLTSGGWGNQEVVNQILAENFGRYNQIQAESYLAAQFAFTFGKNKEIVAYEMESLDFQTEYEVNPKHRAYVFSVVEDVPFVYCEGVDLATKSSVARGVLLHQEATVSQLSEYAEVSERHIRNVLPVLEAEGLVHREKRKSAYDLWIDRGITNSYLDDLVEDKEGLEEE